MGEHMQWRQVTDSVEVLKSLLREAEYYAMWKLRTNIKKKIKNKVFWGLLPLLGSVLAPHSYEAVRLAL